jgi:hypothetical protein
VTITTRRNTHPIARRIIEVNNTDPLGLFCVGSLCTPKGVSDALGGVWDNTGGKVVSAAGEVAKDAGEAIVRNRGTIATVVGLGACFIPAVGWVGCAAASAGAFAVRAEQRFSDGSKTALRDTAIDGGLTYLTLGLGGAFSVFDDIGRVAYGGRFITGGYDAVGLAQWNQERTLLARLRGC